MVIFQGHWTYFYIPTHLVDCWSHLSHLASNLLMKTLMRFIYWISLTTLLFSLSGGRLLANAEDLLAKMEACGIVSFIHNKPCFSSHSMAAEIRTYGNLIWKAVYRPASHSFMSFTPLLHSEHGSWGLFFFHIYLAYPSGPCSFLKIAIFCYFLSISSFISGYYQRFFSLPF